MRYAALFCLCSGHAAAQCNLPSGIQVSGDCLYLNVHVTFNLSNATPPYEYAIDVEGIQYNGGGTDPTGFTHQVPWSGAMAVHTIGVAVHDAADCNAFPTWSGTITRSNTPLSYSLTLDCTTGLRTLRWTNADQACGSAGTHTARVGANTGTVASLFTQESASVWRYNSALPAPGMPFGIDAGVGTYPGYPCGTGVQCWGDNTSVQLSLPYVQPGDCGVNFNLKAALQGPLATNGTMGEGLRTANLVPLTEPYSALGYTYTGNPSLTAVPSYYMTTAPWAIVDWMVVELRSAQNPATVVYSKPVLIKKDGRVHDKNFYDQISGALDENLNFPVAAGDYHVVLRHRNHLAIMTATAIPLDAEPEMLDLRTAAVSTYGTNARVNLNGVMALWAGDATGNGTVKYTGAGNDRDPILTAVGSTTPNNSVSNAYDRRDTNLDGVIKYTGSANDRDIILTNVGSTTPNNTRTQQLP